MGGENQAFEDMDAAPIDQFLRDIPRNSQHILPHILIMPWQGTKPPCRKQPQRQFKCPFSPEAQNTFFFAAFTLSPVWYSADISLVHLIVNATMIQGTSPH